MMSVADEMECMVLVNREYTMSKVPNYLKPSLYVISRILKIKR